MTTPSLAAGASLGPYDIESFLGAGGMGEVYRARDRRIERTVAIKILLGGCPADERRRERFYDEARAISSLSHPHIPAFYDVGSENGVDFLVMEYVEGVTLAALLQGHPLPFDRALRYGIETSGALAAAHRRGIVHCDIKPANVMVTSGGIKLLDFGISRLWSDLHAPSDPDAATTATNESGAAGTRSYMSPERLAGSVCDARGDVYALGVILYELFTGRKPYPSGSRSQLIAAIHRTDPPAPSALNAEVPPALDHLVLRCLAREPDARWQSTADLASELSWGGRLKRPPPAAAKRGRVPYLMAAMAIGLVLAVIGPRLSMSPGAVGQPPAAVRFLVEAQLGSSMTVSPGAFSVSPDGRNIVFTATAAGGKRILWLRSIGDAYQPRPLPGTDDAWNPFWHSDSRRVGFFAGDRIRGVDVGSGAVATIGVLPPATRRGSVAAWGRDGDILIATGPALLRMSDADGSITTLDLHPGVSGLRYAGPSFLPDGRRVVYHAKADAPWVSGLYVGSLDAEDPPRLIVESDSQGGYAEPGYLLYVRGGELLARRVDPLTLEPAGPTVSLVESLSFFNTFNQAAFSVSRGGVLAYRVGIVTSELRWFDRAGRLLSVLAPAAPYANPALSPDGTRVAVTRFDRSIGTTDIWVIDARGGLTQLTSAPTTEDFSTWTPDGGRIVFSATVDGVHDLFEKAWSADAAAPFEPVLADGQNKMPYQWGTARQLLLFLAAGPEGFLNGRFLVKAGRGGVHAVPTAGDSQTREDGQPQISPDGRWLAYVSDVTGSPHVFVRPFPNGPTRWLISPSGGFEPRWRGDGRELFYVAQDGTLMTVDVTAAAGAFSSAAPRSLFRTNLVGSYLGSPFPTSRMRNEYQVSADGERILINEPVEGTSAYAVHVLVNWPALLAERQP